MRKRIMPTRVGAAPALATPPPKGSKVESLDGADKVGDSSATSSGTRLTAATLCALCLEAFNSADCYFYVFFLIIIFMFAFVQNYLYQRQKSNTKQT